MGYVTVASADLFPRSRIDPMSLQARPTQHLVDRNPVHPRRLHRHHIDRARFQPRRHLRQFVSTTTERANRFRVRGLVHRDVVGLLPDIHPRAIGGTTCNVCLRLLPIGPGSQTEPATCREKPWRNVHSYMRGQENLRAIRDFTPITVRAILPVGCEHTRALSASHPAQTLMDGLSPSTPNNESQSCAASRSGPTMPAGDGCDGLERHVQGEVATGPSTGAARRAISPRTTPCAISRYDASWGCESLFVSISRNFHGKDTYTAPTPQCSPRDSVADPPPSPTPRCLDNPCLHAPLSDPGGPPTPGHYSAGDGVFRTGYYVDSATMLIAGLNHAACTLPVYASRPGLPLDAQHSVPAGGQPWPGRTLTCSVAQKVSVMSILATCLPPSLSPSV